MPQRKPTSARPAGRSPRPKPGAARSAAPKAGPKPFRKSPAAKAGHGKGFRGKRATKEAQLEALRGLRAGKASHLKELRGKPIARTAFSAGTVPQTLVGPDTGRLAALMAVEAGLEKKAERPALLDVRGISSYADYVVVMSADNRRQIEAVALEIEHRLRSAGIRPMGSEGNGDTGWLLIDFADVVIHVFTPEARDFYDIEGLWADAPRVKTAV